MDVFEAIRTVVAVRQFREEAIPESVVRQIVEAGRLTASGANAQPWHFIVVENKDTLRQLGVLARTGPYVAQAPLAVVVGVEKSNPLAVSDASRAIQDMILTAWAEGIGSNWVGFRNLESVRSALGMPEEIEVLAILPFGYPTRQVGAGKKQRKSLGEFVSREQFGQPYD